MSHGGMQGQSESEEGFGVKVLGAWIARCALGVIFSSAVLAAQAHAGSPTPLFKGR